MSFNSYYGSEEEETSGCDTHTTLNKIKSNGNDAKVTFSLTAPV